ncbi:aBC-2 type transporter [Prevotella sp. CAG:891]|jgi:ABC-2 type transport system permease protein|nr:ABC transporter permease [Prevotellamassilia sp.]CDE87878.1 aBC-2 type transporter [Prevotella sp. CAG:891]
MFSIFLRELRRLAVQPIYWFCMVIAPLFCYFFFTSLMHEGLPESLPLGVVDEDHTVTSRNLVRNLDAFQMTDVVKTYSNVTEARKAVQQGHIYGFYLIPQGTTSEAQSQRLPTISFYTNYSYLVAGSLLYRDMRTMSELASGAASRTVLYAKGATERQAMAYLQPVVIDMHAVGNPWLNYNVYLSNVIIPGMLGLFIFMITVYGLGTELKFNTADELMQRSGGSVIVAVTGKLIPQLLVFLLSGTLYVLYLYAYLHFPCHCGLARMWCIMALFVMACQGMGVFMFTMFPTLRLGLSFASLWGVISFSISGMSFPVMAMHPILQGIANLFPLRHYFLLYVNSALDGYPLANAWPFVLALLAFALLPWPCMFRLKKVLTTYRYEP